MTASGKTCQRWDMKTPHAHILTHPSEFGEEYLFDAVNFCRNPRGTKTKPWCMTTDPETRDGLCDIPMCGTYIFLYVCSFVGYEGKRYQPVVASYLQIFSCTSLIFHF